MLGDVHVARDARVDRIEGGQTELIASRSRRALVAAVAFVVQVTADQRGVRLTALSIEGSGQLPAAQQHAGVAVHALAVMVEFPDAAQNESVSHVVVARSAIEGDME